MRQALLLASSIVFVDTMFFAVLTPLVTFPFLRLANAARSRPEALGQEIT